MLDKPAMKAQPDQTVYLSIRSDFIQSRLIVSYLFCPLELELELELEPPGAQGNLEVVTRKESIDNSLDITKTQLGTGTGTGTPPGAQGNLEVVTRRVDK